MASRSTRATRSPRKHFAGARGFSLLEMLAVITIIGILAAIILPRIGSHTTKAKENVCHQYRGDLNSALDRYYFETGTWATSLSEIEANDNYYPTQVPICPVTGQAYTIDPTTHRISGHDH